jgi:hypothetical protein
VFSSPTATIEVVGNTGNTSSEKAALYQFPLFTQDDGQEAWNEGNTGAGSITVRSS